MRVLALRVGRASDQQQSRHAFRIVGGKPQGHRTAMGGSDDHGGTAELCKERRELPRLLAKGNHGAPGPLCPKPGRSIASRCWPAGAACK